MGQPPWGGGAEEVHINATSCKLDVWRVVGAPRRRVEHALGDELYGAAAVEELRLPTRGAYASGLGGVYVRARVVQRRELKVRTHVRSYEAQVARMLVRGNERSPSVKKVGVRDASAAVCQWQRADLAERVAARSQVATWVGALVLA